MSCTKYKSYRLSESVLQVIALANEIIDEYLNEGYALTLRQLYYQFVARGHIQNNDREYTRLGSIINKGRLAGLVDWEAIVDRTRASRSITHWHNPAEIIKAAADTYRIDTRADQDTYIEVWVEKDALIDIVEQACRLKDVPCLSCRGYVSQTAMWTASERFSNEQCYGSKEAFIEKGTRKAVLLHFGDHDPSGIDMTRDIQDRLDMFGAAVEVKRVALTMEQIEEYNPPPNPAKITDSRSSGYIGKYGESSWELDALDPRVIAQLIQSEIDDLTDPEKRAALRKMQEEQRSSLEYISEHFTNLVSKKRPKKS